MFIPSASALGIYDATESDYLCNYYLNPPVPEDECPFDAYSLTNTVQSHIHINYTIYNWLEEQLSAYIVGADNAETGSTYTLSGYYGTVTWSTSNSNVATINNSGRLTAHGNGLVTIIAESYSNGKLFRKKKDIMVGFPDIVIKSSYKVGEGYVFSAESTDSDATEMLQDLVSDGNFQYEWSLIDSNGEITTQTSGSSTFKYLPKENEAITIAVRLVSSEGNKGTLKSVSINLRVPFITNYEYVIVTENNSVYFIKSNGTYDVGVPSEDFIVKYNYTVYDQNDSVFQIGVMVNKYIKGTDCYIEYPAYPGYNPYLTGTRILQKYEWMFTFFDTTMFLNPLQAALFNSSGSERTMHEFDLTICNSLKERMQKIPFVIIYKPTFPEN